MSTAYWVPPGRPSAKSSLLLLAIYSIGGQIVGSSHTASKGANNGMNYKGSELYNSYGTHD
jgi:hypothetical protein